MIGGRVLDVVFSVVQLEVSSEIWYWKKKLEEVVDVRFVVGDEGSSGSTCSLDGKMANARNLVRCHGQSRDRV